MQVRICKRMTMFCLDNRYLLLAQNSRSTALWATAGAETHALQKQVTASTLKHNDKGCVAASSSLNVVFSLCDRLYCIVSSFLFAGSYASWQDLFQSILHFKRSLTMFNHSIFLPCDVGLPDSNYLCYYVQIFLFDFEILFHACWLILSPKHPSHHSQWIWPLLHGLKILINIECVLKNNVMILPVPWSLRLSISEAVRKSFSGEKCGNSVIIPSGLFKCHAKL